MRVKSFLSGLIALCCLFSIFASGLYAAWYSADIAYQQAITKILKRGDISWGAHTDDYYEFGMVIVSADGTKVLFTGVCEYCSPAEVRPFLVNPDGSGLEDLSAMLPADIVNRWSAWRNLLINDDASEVFFRAIIEDGYYDDEYLYVYDLATENLQQAVSQEFSPFGTGWHFRIDTTGDTVYLDKLNGGYSDALGRDMRGLFYAATGGAKQFYFDIHDLDCDSECDNLNMFALMGTSVQNDRAFFMYDSDYWNTDGSNQHTGLYYTGLDGVQTLIGGEHYWIDEGDRRGICDSGGTKVIYRYRHADDEPNQLAVVDVASESASVVGWTYGLNGFDSHMSRSGDYILVNGEFGDGGTYYQTIIDLTTDTSRDTWSYYLPSRWGSTSNITQDDRYYFYSRDGSAAETGLYRIDMRSTGDAHAPYVQQINFSAPALLDQDGVTIAVQVPITDPQGTANVDWVRLVPLVEGQEDPPWPMAREPLAYPSGDAGSTLLYDDGTHGDVTAGDGVFSFNSIATRKGDRIGDSAFNTWYQHYTLPAEVGIRVIVKDNDNNYTLADTLLTICDNDCELSPVMNEDAQVYYDTIQAGYDNALDQETLLCQAIGFNENLQVNDTSDKTIVLKGGMDPAYCGDELGVTQISGALDISRGALVFAAGCFAFQ